jgi:hypothetical protein
MANVEHSTLTGTDLHESKGVAAAANNRVYVTNGAGSGAFSQVPAAAIAAAGVLVFQGQHYHIRDERSSGTTGDALTLSAWNTRALNTEVTDDLGITTSGNQMSLVAGTYFIHVEAATQFSGLSNSVGKQVTNKLRLRNITDSSTLVNGLSYLRSDNDQSGANAEDKDFTVISSMSGRFTLAGTKAVEVQNWVTNSIASGPAVRGGKAISSGENEIYLDVKLWKLS